MKLIITFFNKTFDHIRSAYLSLSLRYKSVKFTHIAIGGGLFKGFFEVISYSKTYKNKWA